MPSDAAGTAMSSFFQSGSTVEIRRVDERGDSLHATVAGTKGGKVALKWRGEPPRKAPGVGALVRVIRDFGERQEAVTSQVSKVDASAMIVMPKSKPARYDKRQYLRVEASVPLQFTAIDPSQVEGVVAEIETAKRGSRHIPSAPPIPPGASSHPAARTRTSRPQAALAGLSPELLRRLDRIEDKLDQILAAAAPKQQQTGLRQVCPVNISGSGIRFEHSSSVTAGAYLDCEVELPLSPVVYVRMLVQVLRCDPVPGRAPPKHTIAGAYAAIHEHDQGEIVRFSFERQRQLRELERKGDPKQSSQG